MGGVEGGEDKQEEVLVFFFSNSNDRKNIPLCNVDIAEISRGLPADEEARQGYIYRLHIYIER